MPPLTPTPNPNIKTPFSELPLATRDQIATFYLSRFSEFIVGIVDCIENVVRPSNCLGELGADYQHRTEGLAEELITLAVKCEEIRLKIPELSDREQKSAYFVNEVQPCLAGLHAVAVRGFALNEPPVKRYDSGGEQNLYLKYLVANFQYARAHIELLRFPEVREVKLIEVNSFLKQFATLVHGVIYAVNEEEAPAVRQDMEFVLRKFIGDISGIRVKHMEEFLNSRAGLIFKEIAGEFERDEHERPTLDLLYHGLLAPPNGILCVTTEGIQFFMNLPDCLVPAYAAAVETLQQSLKTMEDLLGLSSHTTLTLDFQSTPGDARIALNIGLLKSSKESPYQADELERREFEIPMRIFRLPRAHIDLRGEPITYIVELDGAALSSKAAWGNVCEALTQTDQYAAACPECRAVRFHTVGDAEMFMDNYASGNYDVQMCAQLQSYVTVQPLEINS